MKKYRFDNEAPETAVALPDGNVRVFYEKNKVEETRTRKENEGTKQESTVSETVSVWECKAVDMPGPLNADSYPALVGAIMADRYSQADELAILRQRDSKPDEFEEYNRYAENVKAFAKGLLGIVQE